MWFEHGAGCVFPSKELLTPGQRKLISIQGNTAVNSLTEMTMLVGGETVTVYNDDCFDRIRQKCANRVASIRSSLSLRQFRADLVSLPRWSTGRKFSDLIN